MLQDVGLISRWEKQLMQTRPCYNDDIYHINSRSSKSNKPLVRLALGNLAGAFVLLVAGSFISIIVFLKEIFVYRYCIRGSHQ